MLSGGQLYVAYELGLRTDLGKGTNSSLFLSSEIVDSVGKTQGSCFTLLAKLVDVSKSLGE